MPIQDEMRKKVLKKCKELPLLGNSAFSSCTNLTSVTFCGYIPSTGFSTSSFSGGDLRDKFYTPNSANGTPGTYTRASGSATWTRQ
jgi:hypothetical protein